MKIARLSLYAFFAVFLLVVSCGKEGGDPDPNTKPTSKTQAQRVKDLQNSILLGISLSDLKKEGYTLDEFLLAEVSVEDILTAGFTLIELLEEDEITIAELKSNDITLQQFYDAGVSIKDLWEADYTVNELLAIDGIDIADLKSSNVPLQAILDAEQSVQDALAGGFTINELLALEGITVAYLKSNNIGLADLFAANVPVSDLWDAGFGVSELLALNGIGVSELKSGGVPVKSMYEAGVSVHDLMSGGYTMIELLSLEGVTLQVFIQQGYTLEDFVEAGVSVDDLWGVGYSTKEIYDAGMPLIDIFNTGVGVGTLREYGATEVELKTAGLIGSVNDIDNNNYGWVRIGDQIWMSENFKATRDNNGNALTTYVYDNNLDYIDIYGRFYEKYTVYDHRNSFCPTGWKLPEPDDWNNLLNYIGPDAYLELKEKGDEYWEASNNGTNSWGFNARGGGKMVSSVYSNILKEVNYGTYDHNLVRLVLTSVSVNSHDYHERVYVRCMKNVD